MKLITVTEQQTMNPYEVDLNIEDISYIVHEGGGAYTITLRSTDWNININEADYKKIIALSYEEVKE